jgi:hypothetical protein
MNKKNLKKIFFPLKTGRNGGGVLAHRKRTFAYLLIIRPRFFTNHKTVRKSSF